MVAPELLEYVRHRLLQGRTPEQIRQRLTAKGWKASLVDLALKQATVLEAARSAGESAANSAAAPRSAEGASGRQVAHSGAGGSAQPVRLAAVMPVQAVHPAQANDLLMWFFRAGFAGVFLINAVVAVVDPGGFVKLMQSSFMGAFVKDFTPFVWLIALNDLFLGLLILSGRWAVYVLAWSGLWLLAVTVLKFSSLFG